MPRKRKPRPSLVYVIGCPVQKIVKIGYTANPRRRFEELQCGCPFDLFVFRVFEGAGKQAEQKLHAQFKGAHVRGEWYALTPQLLETIGSSRPVPMAAWLFARKEGAGKWAHKIAKLY
jgi:hypothetical protein